MVSVCACEPGPDAPLWATAGARAAPVSPPDAAVLPRPHRLRRSVEFDNAVRRGFRAASRSVVLHQIFSDQDEPVRVGFIVSRAVGNAVTRNLVRRRLSNLMALRLPALDQRSSVVVVRANPVAASLSFRELGLDLDVGLRALSSRRSSR